MKKRVPAKKLKDAKLMSKVKIKNRGLKLDSLNKNLHRKKTKISELVTLIGWSSTSDSKIISITRKNFWEKSDRIIKKLKKEQKKLNKMEEMHSTIMKNKCYRTLEANTSIEMQMTCRLLTTRWWPARKEREEVLSYFTENSLKTSSEKHSFKFC